MVYVYRFFKITEAGIVIDTEFSLQITVQLKLNSICKSSLEGCVSVFKCTIMAYRNSWALDTRLGRWSLNAGGYTVDPGHWMPGSRR